MQAVAGILRAQKAKIDGSLTNEEIARAATGVGRSQVAAILKGDKHVDIEQLDYLCYALGLNLTDVVRDAEAEVKNRKLDKSWPARPVDKSGLVAGK